MTGEIRYRALVCGYLATCIVLGGASAAGVLANLALQLGAVVLAVIAVRRLQGAVIDRHQKLMLALLAGVLVLPLLQLVPLGPTVWRDLPGREVAVDGFVALGLQLPWLPLSLDPAATLASWLALFPGVALCVAVLSLGESERVWLGWTILALALISALLAVAQLASDAAYIYDITSRGSGVGFFANRNHLASLLLVAIPTLTLQLPGSRHLARGRRPAAANDLFVLGLLAVLLLGLLAAGSRAGLGLALPVLVASIGLRLRAHTGESPVRLVAVASATAVAVVAAVTFGPWWSRIAAKTVGAAEAETRLIATPITLNEGWQVFPVGSGFGTFEPIFKLVGGDVNLGANYINHAHNDYAELWLTGGLPAVALLAFFIWWFVSAARAGWRARADNAGAVPRVAALTIAVLMIHSLVDYPLRTAAIAAIFGASAALLLSPVRRRPAPARRLVAVERPQGRERVAAVFAAVAQPDGTLSAAREAVVP